MARCTAADADGWCSITAAFDAGAAGRNGLNGRPRSLVSFTGGFVKAIIVSAHPPTLA